MRKVELQLGNLFDTQERLLAQKTPPTALMYRYLKDEVREKIKELQYTAGEEVARLKAAGIGPAVIQPIADNYSARRQELRSLLVQLNGD